MNNAEHFPMDAEAIEAERDWLNARKADGGLSWPQLATFGIPAGTLSSWATGSYRGDQARIARAVFRFRQLEESQAERSVGLIEEPGYFETPTSLRLMSLLIWAHRGRITLGATGPGTGKDMAAQEYAGSVANAWVATMRESDCTVAAMCRRVLRAIGVDVRGGGSAQHMSDQVIDKVQGKRGLLIINEANHLGVKEIEEIRGWHDVPGGPGICLLGNEELLMRIEGGTKRDAYGRLNSRIAQRHIQTMPEEGDVAAFCAAWGLTDPSMRQMLTKIARTPGTGGLRECKQIVEQASVLASGENRPLSFDDLRDAQSTRATRHIRV